MADETPEEALTRFLADCDATGRVFVTRKAADDAGTAFRLTTQAEIMAFIVITGKAGLAYVNTKPLNSDATCIVHGYRFRSGPKKGYLAFFESSTTKKWIIKSFHLDTAAGELTTKPFANL